MLKLLKVTSLLAAWCLLFACSEPAGNTYIKKLPVYPGAKVMMMEQTILAWIADVDIKYYETADNYPVVLDFYKKNLPTYRIDHIDEKEADGRMAVLSATDGDFTISVFVMEMKEEERVMIGFSAMPTDDT